MIGVQVLTAHRSYGLEGWDFRRNDSPDSIASLGEDRNAIFRHEVAIFLNSIEGPYNNELCSFRDAHHTQRTLDAVRRAVISGRTEDVIDAP